MTLSPDELWEEHKGLVYYIARKAHETYDYLDVEDLISASMLGYAKSLTTCPDMDAIVPYLRVTCRREILNYIDKSVKIHTSKVEELRQVRERELDTSHRCDLSEILKRIVRGLETKERFVIESVFFDYKNTSEAGRELGVTPVRAAQIKDKALRQLRLNYRREMYYERTVD